MHEAADFKHGGRRAGDEETAADRSQRVVVKLPQGYDTRINVRLVPARDIRFTPDVLGCQPRKGAPRRDAQPLPLPDSLAEKLKAANDRMVAWLAQGPANAQLFLARPVEALVKAGIDLTRSEQKQLDRAHRAVKEASVVAPGVRVTELSAAMHTGRVGELRPTPRKEEPKGGSGHCGPTEGPKE